jgi:hypothetical protein
MASSNSDISRTYSNEESSVSEPDSTDIMTLVGLFKEVQISLEAVLKENGWQEQHHDIISSLNRSLLDLRVWSKDIRDANVTLPLIERNPTQLKDLAREIFKDILRKTQSMKLWIAKDTPENR